MSICASRTSTRRASCSASRRRSSWTKGWNAPSPGTGRFWRRRREASGAKCPRQRVPGGPDEQSAVRCRRAKGARVSGTRPRDAIRLAKPDVGAEELAAVAEVLESGQLTMGPKVGELEGLLAEACGVTHAVAVSSGTAALHLAVRALGIGPGDEVIVPAYTFPATANAVELCDAKAVLVDVDPDTFNVQPTPLYDAVTPRTKAVLVEGVGIDV